MELASATERLTRSQGIKLCNRHTGKTFRGHDLWTRDEDDIVCRLSPDFAAIKRALKRRTLSAVKYRASRLRLLKSPRPWTSADVGLLRRMYPKAKRNALLECLPGRSWGQIAAKAFKLGLRRPKRVPTKSGIFLIDAIRTRAIELNMSMHDIDVLARTKTYFRRSLWFGQKTGSAGAIARAIEALGGRLVIEWDD